jgi:hypothetical protein
MYENHRQFRAEGFAPQPAAEATARLYGRTDPEDVRTLARTLSRLEQRARPADAGGPMIKVPSGLADVYLTERRAGKSHETVRAFVRHTYAYDGASLDQALARPRREFEAELEAWRPRVTANSTQEANV